MKKILLIDIGNTNIVFGICNKDNSLKENIISYRYSTNINETIDEFGLKFLLSIKNENINLKDLDGAIISSVVPQIDDKINFAIEKYLNIKSINVTAKMNLGIPITYSSPNEIGIDRLVNAVSGIKIYGKPLIIVDMGTAVTIDVISKKGEYSGGIIFQGMEMSLNALSTKTAKLPKIKVSLPKNIIGKNTLECMQNGVYYSFLGGIKYIIEKIKKETKESSYKVILTGGHTFLFKNETEIFDIFDKDLTLKGLKTIYNKLIINNYGIIN
jgi:type III pantothenate kinase